MPPILFAIESAESRSLPLNAQRLVNLFTERQPQGAKSQTPLFGVPGMSAFADTTAVVGGVATLGMITGGSNYIPSSSSVASLGTIIGGSGYTAGTYTGVSLTGGTGSGALATIIVGSNGEVANVYVTAGGSNYLVGDALSAAASSLGGVGQIATLGSITGGSSYTNGTYNNVPLTGGSGTGAKATVIVSGGAVTAVTITAKGINYLASDTLSATAASIGGTGSGFSVPVATVASPGTGFSVPVATLNTYRNIPLVGGHGTGAQANITVNGAGAVSQVIPTAPGENYEVGDILTATAAVLGSAGGVHTLGSITGGMNYLAGTYTGVPLTGGSGTGAQATVTVNSSGAVSAVSATVPGINYQVNDTLSVAASSIGSTDAIVSLGSITGGSGYIPGTYTGVPLFGGTGNGATATITVNGSGVVSAVTLTADGQGFTVSDILSAAASNIGGAGGISSLGSITGGSGYLPGTYTNVPLSGGTGTGALATIVVNGSGIVSAVTITTPGVGYADGDVLTLPAASGGAVSLSWQGAGQEFYWVVVGKSITGGSGYYARNLSGTWNLPGNGNWFQGGAPAISFTVAAGIITGVILTGPSSNPDSVWVTASATFPTISIAAGGSGFSVPVATVSAGSGFSVPVASVVTGSGFSVPVSTIYNGSGFSVPVAVISASGTIRGSWVKQDIPYVVSGNALYQLSLTSSGTYEGVALTGGSGSGAQANITITGGVVTAVTLTAGGQNYALGDVLSAPLGGGTGFSVPVATLSGTAIATLGTITGGTNYQFGSASIVGTGITGTDMVGMSDNGDQLCIVSGQSRQGWILDTNPSSATYGFQNITPAWTAAGFGPANTVSFFDGYFVFDMIGTNEFFISALYDGTSYNGLDFASAESQPDFVTGTVQNLQLLFVICQAHLELWYDAGASNFPFQRYTGAGISYGCVSPRTIIKQDGAIFFLGSDKIFYRLQSTVPIRASTHAIEHIIAQDTNIAEAYCFTFTIEGHKFVVLQLPASLRTLIFDISTNRWHERESWDQNNNSLGQWRASTAFSAFNNTYLGDAFNGNVNLLDWMVYTEVGNTIRGLAYSIPYNQDRKRLFVSRFELDIQAGVGLSSGQGSDPQIMLGWSVDGANTFKPLQMWRSMGKIGEYLQRLRWLRMGNGRQFVFVISTTDPVPRVIIAAHADISIGM